MTRDLTNGMLTSVQEMTWWTSHYLSQRWPRFVAWCGVTRPQWVKYTLMKAGSSNIFVQCPPSLVIQYVPCWNGNTAILTKSSSLAPEVITLTTVGAVGDDIFIKMTPFLFQWLVFVCTNIWHLEHCAMLLLKPNHYGDVIMSAMMS